MSFPADDIVRMNELLHDGFTVSDIERYIERASYTTIQIATGKRRGKVEADDRMSTRQRQRYINSMVIPGE